MATSPNDPFNNPQSTPGHPQGQPAAPKKSGGKGCLLGCLLVGGLGVFACCGGSIFITYAGLSVLGSQVESQLAGNADITDRIGEVESFEFSFSGTVQEAQRVGEQGGGQTPLVFDVKGSEGSAQVLVVQDNSGAAGAIQSATLVMPDVTRHEIDLGNETESEWDLEFNDELNNLIDDGNLFDDGDLETGNSAESTVP